MLMTVMIGSKVMKAEDEDEAREHNMSAVFCTEKSVLA